ncbi:MAG: aldo/keto reductase [Lachnospiraceae bacterium]|nr:aldo/keto reductase [Lachnospiraceae bacterium]
MRYIEFGTQKSQVSEIVIGLMRISRMNAAEVEQLVEASLEEGINAFDLANIYGGGHCEELIGQLLQRRPELRNRMWIQSKCGIRHADGYGFFDFSKEHILEATDTILARLKTDHLDSLLLHRPDALMEPEEVAEAFETLKKAGKVLDFGVSNQNAIQMQLMSRDMSMPIAANQLQLSPAFTPSFNDGFNVNMENDAGIVRGSGVFEYCRLQGIVIQSWSSLQYGYFEGTFLGSEKYADLNRVLDRMAEEKNVTPMAIALAWILRYPGKVQAVIGTTKVSRIRDAARTCDFSLSRQEWYEIYAAAGNRLP